jgi:hypothetical protein
MDWKISSLRFVNEMYNGLCHFFDVSAEETTEAELHQKLIEAGTLENIRVAATKEANDAVAAQMAGFQTKLDALTAQVEGLQTDADEKATKVGELETELETVKGQVAGKDGEIIGHLAQIKSLSGEVAGLRAGKPIDKSTPPDESKPVHQTKAPSGVIISGKEIEAAYAKAVAAQN